MSAVCPEGHRSQSTDYCDTCGMPMAGSAATPQPPSPAEPAPEPAPTQTCPHCGGVNVADALFCEACGYDFTTGTPPMGSEPAGMPSPASPEPVASADEDSGGPSDLHNGSDEAEGAGSADGVQVEGSGEEPVEEVDPDVQPGVEGAPEAAKPEEASEPEVTPERGEDGEPEVQEQPEPDSSPDETEPEPPDMHNGSEGQSGDPSEADVQVGGSAEAPDETPQPTEPEPTPDPAPPTPEPEPDPAPPPPSPTPARKARHTPPSRALADTWVAELWVDPDWYAVQQTDEACPSVGLPDTILLNRSTALIGRPSGSMGLRPEIDAGSDSAVSRRHAQLTSDGQRWWIEDLGSSNGTYLGTVGEELPTAPITPGQRVEIDRDDRIYLGAWTRLVLRQATASEKEGQG